MNTVKAYVDLEGETLLAGTLYRHVRRGREATSFRYEEAYIAHPRAYALEPAMPLALGDYSFGEGLPHSFRDASPDRWGRLLIEKGLQQVWMSNKHAARTVTEVDYLLGTSDVTRQGALRFKEERAGAFQGTGSNVPKSIALPKLLSAAQRLCQEEGASDIDDYAAVKVLLDAGTGSLGGARPKASIYESFDKNTNMLYLAKFAHPADRWDVMKWERITLDLAARAGIEVPKCRLVDMQGSSVLLLERFDRTENGERIGFMSALTLLEGERAIANGYLDIADGLSQASARSSHDLSELWRRLLFTLAVNNTDDHLRNHALLRFGQGWCLSPAFDMNPDPDIGRARVTDIGGAVTFEESWSAAFEFCEWFGLSRQHADHIAVEVLDAVAQWDTVARIHGASVSEMRLFAPAFTRAVKVR